MVLYRFTGAHEHLSLRRGVGLILGAAGVVVSNHGGRQLDTVPSGAAALGPVVEAIDGRADVLVDGESFQAWVSEDAACMVVIAGATFVYVTLRSLKRHTRLLRVAGR